MEMVDPAHIIVVYYHNDDLHNTIFNTSTEHVMVPIGALRGQLNELFAAHGLNGWEDPLGHVPLQRVRTT